MNADPYDSAIAVDKFRKAFGCPAGVAELAISHPTPMLLAIAKLGPKRVRWQVGKDRCWVLDGKLATPGEIERAAPIAPMPQKKVMP